MTTHVLSVAEFRHLCYLGIRDAKWPSRISSRVCGGFEH